MKSQHRLYLLVIPLIAMLLPGGSQSLAQNNTNAYRAETVRWRAADGKLAAWQRDAVLLAQSGELRLDTENAYPGTDPYGPGGYKNGNFYNGHSYFVGAATGPVLTTAFRFSQAIPSWNATTPPGTWIEVKLRARVAGRWTQWFNMGVWASDQATVKRHSVSGQSGSSAYVDVDTLKVGRPGSPATATAYQLMFRLFATSRDDPAPSIENAAVVASTTPTTPAQLSAGSEDNWGKVLNVPECSQMVYPDGGEVWCSPTSVAMVLNYWRDRPGSCPASVEAAVSGVYDRVYKGHGNWPFNTGYAYSTDDGLESYVTRFTSMAQAEEWIAAGVPVIMSVSWGRNQLTGAPIPASSGHLIVLVGFDAEGNPIVNDPAAASNVAVQRTYMRSELEKLWLRASGGTAYLIYPSGRAVPASPGMPGG